MSEFNHGTYTLERETSYKQTTVSGDIPVVVVAAPIHLATDPQINTPILCYSLDEVAKYFGYVNENSIFSSNRVVDIFMKLEGLAPLGIINILDSAKHKSEMVDKSVNLSNGEYTEEIHGILIDTVVVKEGTTTLTLNTDYYKQYTSAGYVKITKVNGGTIVGTNLKLSYTHLDTTKITEADIVGGKDLVSGKLTGMELIETFNTLYNKEIKGIAIPKYSKSSIVSTVMKAKSSELNCIACIDLPDNVYYTNAPQKKKEQNIYGATQYLTYGYATSGENIYEASIHALAVMTRIDKQNDGNPSESPSNKSIYCDGACIVINGNTETLNLGKSEANYLNENGIATIRNNNGFVLWGTKTAAFPDNSDPKETTLNWKRSMQYYRRDFESTMASSVDGKVTPRFLDTVLNTFKQKFNSEAAKENIYAGEIICDARKNTVGDLIEGTLTYQIKLTFFPNAQAIIGEFELDVDKLSTLTA